MANKLQLRRGTAASWTASNPILADGEPGVETDTNKFKLGNGSVTWNLLPYAAATATELSNGLATKADTTSLPTAMSLTDGNAGTSTVSQTISAATLKASIVTNGGGDITVTNIQALLAKLPDTLDVKLLGYHAANDGGSGVFYYDAVGLKSTHNGGTIIDPSRTFPTTWSNETQKATWFTAGTTGTGVWKRRGDANSIDGRCFGIKLDGLSVPITDNVKAFQAAVDACRVVYLPGGKYLVNAGAIQVRDGMKILSLNNNKIHLIINSINGVIFNLAGGGYTSVNNVEFHGKLECTYVSTGAYSGNLVTIMNFQGTCDGWNFDDTEFDNANCIAQGMGVVSSGADFNANDTWFKNFSARRCVYKSGRMGWETSNHADDLIVSSISIDASAVISVNAAHVRTGMKVLIKDIVGTGVVSSLNEQFFMVGSAITPTTFNIVRADGSAISTLGGTYTSGGTVYVYRLENLDFSYSDFRFSGMTIAGVETFGFGISLSGPVLDAKLDHSSGYNNKGCMVELIGASRVSATFLTNYGTSTIVSATNYRTMYDNVISNCTTVVKAVAMSMVIRNQVRMTFNDNKLSVSGGMQFNSLRDSFICNNVISSDTGSCLLIASNTQELPSKNNFLYDNFLESRLNNYYETLLSFGYTYCYNNIVDRLTLKVTTPITSPILNEWSGAHDNSIQNWRYHDTKGWVVSGSSGGIITTGGLISSFAPTGFSNARVYTKTGGLTALITAESFDVNGGQQPCHITMKFAGRYNNEPMGGEIMLAFGSYSVGSASPVFTSTGWGSYFNTSSKSGTATLIDGSIQVTTPFINAGSIVKLGNYANGLNQGALWVENRINTASFHIKSTNPLDTQQVAWEVINALPQPTITYALSAGGKHTWTVKTPHSDIPTSEIVFWEITAITSSPDAYSIV